MKTALSMLVLVPATLLSACAVRPAEAPSPSDQRLSASVAAQVRRCYRSPRIPSAGRRIVTRLLVRYAPDGTLAGLPILIGQDGITPDIRFYAPRMAEAAKQAVVRCSPVSLPAGHGKAAGIEFYLTFSPQLAA